ncbi:MAG: ribonuclease Z [Euryarchaeota archaeon RBG_19FT_COMBO_56_21]|nr:MAG: ribonuclease Z [Euryarchaeota archaeon RBG_19FT_COMBO_56_21]
MKLVFLGTGGTYPSKLRNVTSIAVQMPGEVLMFDCGEGTQRQLMHSSVSFMRISKIFITHLHADHFLGLPGLIQSMSLNGREEPLAIFGPRGTKTNVNSMLRLGYFKCAFDVKTKDLRPGTELRFPGYKIESREASHSVPSLAFSLEEDPRPGRFDVKKAELLGIPEGPLFRRLQEGGTVSLGGRKISSDQVLGPKRPGRKMVYSGDTKPSKAITSLARGADVLIHDCTLDSTHSKLASDFGHSTATEAAQVAKDAGVGILFLVHISPRYDDTSILEEEARSIFPDSHVAKEFSEHVVRLRE